MRSERLFSIASLGVLATATLWGFNRKIKKEINERQNGKCAMCDHEIQEYHHIIPERALIRRSDRVKGKNIPENGVGVCDGRWGRGVGSRDDHHEIMDRKAINERLFWNGSEFVPLDQVDKGTYTQLNQVSESKKNKNKEHRRKRGKKH